MHDEIFCLEGHVKTSGKLTAFIITMIREFVVTVGYPDNPSWITMATRYFQTSQHRFNQPQSFRKLE
jgi:hypothetical protein